jgi:DNA-binding beta-propeller fold protein YncE
MILRCATVLLCAVSFSLSGCAGTPIQPLTPHASSSNAFATRKALPYQDALYVSDPIDNRVDIYPLNTVNPAPIGEIGSGLQTPTGMAVDTAHVLYVANNTDNIDTSHAKDVPYFVTVFDPGSGYPKGAYSQDLRHPTDVAIGSDGTVYVASFADGYITEYPAGSMLPSQHFLPPSGSAFAVALDSQNNLYVACTIANAVFEFAPGSTRGTNLGLVLSGEPHGMAIDRRGNLLVAVSAAPNSGSVVDVFPKGKTRPSVQFGGVFQPFMIDLDRGEHNLYVADYGSGNHDGAVFEFSYPVGTIVNKYTQGAASAAYGVAVNPPAPF